MCSSDLNPTVRGDAAYLIGIISDSEDLGVLMPLLNDPEPQVAESVKDSMSQNDGE